jgi:hypothetical protein
MSQAPISPSSTASELSAQDRGIWRSLLNADMNARYWGYIARRYQMYDRVIGIFLAVMSASAVAAWVSAQGLTWAGQILSMITAGLAVARPLLQIDRTAQAAVELAAEWAAFLLSYEDLWNNLASQSVESATAKLHELNQRKLKLLPTEVRLPRDPKLIEKSYNKVLNSRGLQGST